MMQERFARLEVKAELYVSAKQRYQRIIEANPRAHTSLLSLALLELELGEVAQAKTNFLSLLQVNGYADVSSYYLGVISHSEGDYQQAVAFLEKVQHPNYYIDANILIAQTLVSTQGLESGILHLDQLKATENDDLAKVFRVQAIFYSQFEQWSQSLNYYQLALELAPNDLPIMFGMSMVLYQMKDHEAYETLAKEMVKRFPNEADALNALGYFYVEQNIKLDEAEKLLDRALDIDPNRYHILDSRGWLEYQRGNYQAAEGYLQRAWALQKDAEVLVHLFKAKWAQGKRAQAEKLWQQYAPSFSTLPGLEQLINDLTNQ
jgi:tetratricopeptide (TPR) repeat protein